MSGWTVPAFTHRGGVRAVNEDAVVVQTQITYAFKAHNDRSVLESIVVRGVRLSALGLEQTIKELTNAR